MSFTESTGCFVNISEHVRLLLAIIEYSLVEVICSFLFAAKDPELRALAEADSGDLETELNEIAKQLAVAIVPRSQFDELRKCQLEISS